MKVQILIPFLIYLTLLLIFSIYTTRNVSRGLTGFFLGDRKMNPLAVAVSTVVSARGAWLLLGVTTQAYIMGLSAIWLVTGFILSEIILFIFLAPALRKYSEKHGCVTLMDVFTARFKDRKKSLIIIIASTLLIFSIFFNSAQFMAGGRAFYALLGFSLTNGIIITGIIVMIYVFIGGFKSLMYSDVFNSIVILAILICLPFIILVRKEGFENLQAEILLSSPGFFDIKSLSIGTLMGLLTIGLGSPGNPNILVKYLSIRDTDQLTRMTIVNSITNLLMAAGAICIGIFARIYFPTAESIPGSDPQNVFISLTGVVFTPVLLGLVLITIMATIISSTGPQILVSASMIVNGIFEKAFNEGKRSSQARLIFYSRFAIIALIYITILAGIFIDTDIFRFMLFACAGFGASLGPAIIFTLFWKEATTGGIISGVITGGITVIIWKNIPFLSDTSFEFAPGFILATFAIWIGSKIDKNLKIMIYNRKASYGDIKKTNSNY